MGFLSRHSRALRLPSAERILNFVYAGRVGVAFAAFLATVWVWKDLAPIETLGISITVLAGVAVAALSYAYTGLLGRPATEPFRYAQMVFDCAFVTAIVILTGGAGSPFSPVYVMVIGTAAVLLSLRGGLLIAVLAIILYFAANVWHVGSTPDATVFLQLALLGGVAVITGYLGDRLRQTGTVLGRVESELHSLRLDRDEILDTIGTGILTLDPDGRLAYMNPTGANLLGIRSSEWLGKPMFEELNRLAPRFGDLLRNSMRDRRAIARGETAVAPDSGLLLGVSTTLMERHDAEHPGVTAIFQDISDKMRVEALRRRAERLVAVAGLSASLAHEIKNPLASIRSAAEQLRQGVEDAEDHDILQGLIVRESDRLSRLLGDFLDFARVRTSPFEPIDLGELLPRVVDVVCAHPDADGCPIELELAPGGELRVPGDEDLLHRAFFNLALNAVQWLDEGGRVEIRADVTTSSVVSEEVGASEVVRVRIRDTGPGFPEEITDRVFDPFFTAREGGSGLGLAIVQRAVDAHGGAVIIDPPGAEDGWGGIVTLYFPRAEAGAPETLTETNAT